MPLVVFKENKLFFMRRLSVLKKFHYDSDLIGGSLMVRESRIIAQLLSQQVSAEQWKQAIHMDNVLQKKTPATAQRTATAIRKRLECLSPSLLNMLVDGDSELATQVSLCGVLGRNLLLVEFMETVVKDAYLIRLEKLENYMWMDFLEDRSHRDESILTWAESSKKKMGQVVFRILAESGYLKSTRSLELQNFVIRHELASLLKEQGEYRIYNCMNISVLSQ